MFIEKPWESVEGSQVWKTESQYWVWLRGAIRRIWADYPIRKVWKNSQLRPVTQEERLNKVFHTSTKKVGQCVFCEEWFAGSKLECDHIKESEGCTSKETAEKFLWHCGGLVGKHFQLVCKKCHKIKSLSDRSGLSFEEASIEKEVIAICKAKQDKQWLTDNGIVPASNATKRREQIKQKMMEGIK